MTFKEDFPIFQNNPDLIYFDSTASSQKPNMVIDGMRNFLENNYSNIHRGMYDIAINSEKLYNDSKKIVAKHLGISDYKEIIYTSNATYAANILAQSLKKSGILKKGDTILTSIVEHHANIVPWLILKEELGITIEFIGIDDDYNLDIKDFQKKYTENVKLITFTHVSNVTGQIFDLASIGRLKRADTLFIVDASQSIPHFSFHVSDLNCDFLFFTGHKVFADSGIGVLWGKREILEQMNPVFSGGGAISEVSCNNYTSAQIPDKFEPGTPNITGAVSLFYAFRYIESLGGFTAIEKQEKILTDYFLQKLSSYSNIKLLGSSYKAQRIGVFSLVFPGYHSHDIAEILAENNIAVRSGKHCAHPLFLQVGELHSLRVSLYIYNDTDEIDRFFTVIKKFFIKNQ